MWHPNVTVVLCTYNRAGLLCGALDSLIRQDTRGGLSYEIVVVDDASTDATPKVVREAIARSPVPMRYVLGSGKGLARAQNMGIKESCAEWIAFFDDDELAEPNWLEELVACALQAGVAVVGGAVRLDLSDEELGKLSPVCRSILGATEEGRKLGRCVRKTFPGSGNMLVKATVFQAVGQFDEPWVRGGSDLELSLRCRRAGIEALFTPKAIIRHCVPAYRLKDSYLIWCSLRVGNNFAYRDFREWGLTRTMIACLARIAQASFVNVPLMLLAHMLGNGADVVGRRCLLSRAWGYLRESLYLVSPRLFSQETYFSHLTKRSEGNAFAGSSNSAGRSNPSK